MILYYIILYINIIRLLYYIILYYTIIVLVITMIKQLSKYNIHLANIDRKTVTYFKFSDELIYTYHIECYQARILV